MFCRCLLLFSFAAAMCLPVKPCRADDYVAPQGQIALSRPEISWNVWATNGRTITRTEMTVDGQTVAAVYRPAQRALIYQPASALALGTHSVACRVQLDNGAATQRTWEFSISSDALPSLPAPTSAQLALYQQANVYRQIMGLPNFVLSPALCATAQAHSEYAQKNPGEAHMETQGKPGFRGRTSSERAQAMGYSGGASEDMSWGNSPREAVTSLIEAPYHRLPFMEPGASDFGGGFQSLQSASARGAKNVPQSSGMQGGITTLNFHGKGGKGIVLYPIPEQTDVPLMFSGGETPNPLRLHSASGSTGYVITLAVFGMDTPFRFVRASLTDQSGAAIPFWVNSPENDTHLKNAVFVIPHKPLRAGTTYEVKIGFSLGNRDMERVWRFTTQGKPAARSPRSALSLAKQNAEVPATPLVPSALSKGVFPVAGKTSWVDSFNPNGERKMRTHHGQDLMAAKMTPLIACFDGIVSFGRTATPNTHNILNIQGDNGLSATYMHINNDTPGTDDGLGSERYAFAPGLQSGSHVYAGQLIAFVGDSGNAENVGSHCHFELYSREGCINPKPFLDAATKLTAPLYLLTQRHLQPHEKEVRWEGSVSLADAQKRLLVLDVLATVLPKGKIKSAVKPERQWIVFNEAAVIQSREDVPRTLAFADLKQGMTVSVIGTPTQTGKAASGRLAAVETAPDPAIEEGIAAEKFVPSDKPFGTPLETMPRKSAVPLEHSLSEAILLNLINGFRYRSDKLPALSPNSALMAAAQRHAQDMAKNGVTTHRGSDFSEVADRVRDAGYTAEAVTQQIVLGSRYTSAQFVLDSLVPLPLNRRSLLDTAWTDCGIAHRVFKSARGEEIHVWTIVFAKPRKTL